MSTNALSTDHLDYLQRTTITIAGVPPSIPRTSAPPAFRRLWHITGVGRTEKAPRSVPAYGSTPGLAGTQQSSVRLPSEDVIIGMYGYNLPVAFLVTGEPGHVSIYLGTWSSSANERASASMLDSRQSILSAVLRSVYPSIDLASMTAPQLSRPPLAGLVLGVPTVKTLDPSDGTLPLDRLIRALYGTNWAVVILATPVAEAMTSRLRDSVINEVRSIQAAAEATRAPSPLAQHYTELLKSSLNTLSQGQSVGTWRTGVYLLGDVDSYYRLSSVWRGMFADQASLSEPLRVWEHSDYADLAARWELPDIAGARGPGHYQHPFLFQTLLTSSQLAAYIHLPYLETPGFAVSALPHFDVVPQRIDEVGTVQLGKVIHQGQQTEIDYSISLNALTKHAFVAGVTGAGKTNTIFHLLQAIGNLPFIVLEPAKTEYRALLNTPALKGRLHIFTLGEERVSPFRLNPFEVVGWPKTPVGGHLDLLRAAFSASFGMWTPLPQVLEQCLHAIYRDRGWDITTNTNDRLDDRSDVALAWPTLSDLAAKVDEIVPQLGYDERVTADLRASLRTRIDGLRTGSKGSMLDVQRSLPMSLLLGHPTVLELESIGDDGDKAFLMALLLIRTVEQRRAGAQTKELRHLLVIEEAHRLLANVGQHGREEEANPRGQAVETFNNLLSEIRAYGQGFVIADQVPVRLAPDVIKNTNLKVAHRVVAADDRQVLAGAMAMNEHQTQKLAVLEKGDAAIFCEGDDAPVLVHVKPVKDEPNTPPPSDEQVGAFMAHADAIEPYRMLFQSFGGLIDPSEPSAHSAFQAVQTLRESPALRADFSRLAISLLEDDEALERLWPHICAYAHPICPRQADIKMLIRCLAVLAPARYSQRRGSQAGWTYAETANLDAALRAVLLAHLEGQDVREQLATYRTLARSLHARHVSPFSHCDHICTHKPSACLFRHAVADIIGRDDLSIAWHQSVEQDGGLPGTESWRVCEDAAQYLVEWQSSQKETIQRIGLCFAQQMLARTPHLLPETRLVSMDQLIEAASALTGVENNDVGGFDVVNE